MLFFFAVFLELRSQLERLADSAEVWVYIHIPMQLKGQDVEAIY